MTDFLKLTLQNINAPKGNDGANFDENSQKIKDEPVSIHEVNKSPENIKLNSLTEKIGRLEDTDTVLFNNPKDSLDENIEAGNSVIADCSDNLKIKNEENILMEKNLTELTENIKSSGEILLMATNTLATLMSESKEDQEANIEEIQEATQTFIEAQQNHLTAKAKIENAIKSLDENNSEITKTKEELKGYINILETEKENAKNDSGEDSESAEELQKITDELNKKINENEEKRKKSSSEENEKRNNINDEFNNLQYQYGISVNEDNSVTQLYEDGSSRTFYIEEDENGMPSVVFRDIKPEINEEAEETESDPTKEDYNTANTDNFLEEADIFS